VEIAPTTLERKEVTSVEKIASNVRTEGQGLKFKINLVAMV
jgi:hypothetical protein